jgi:DNA processing protein
VDREEILAVLAFNRITNYTPAQKLYLYNRFDSVHDIFSKRAEAEKVFRKVFKINGKPLSLDDVRKIVDWEITYCRDNGVRVVTMGDDLYPEQLRNIDDPPIVLFARGKIELMHDLQMTAIVGARRAANSSINRAYSIARDLARNGVTVVSGLAFGIDYYAHKGSLDGGGNTIAVLGNGLDVVYPKANGDMYELIARRGLLLSEFPVNTGPLKYNFPKRNRIISGLSKGVIVVEASAKSGALITAGFALDQGRDVMAFPGRAGSDSYYGNNRLIKQGAHLVEDAADICSIIGIEYKSVSDGKSLPFSPLECSILTVIGDDLVSIDEIENNLESPINKISSALSMLEIKGAVIQYPGKNFARVDQYGCY